MWWADRYKLPNKPYSYIQKYIRNWKVQIIQHPLTVDLLVLQLKIVKKMSLSFMNGLTTITCLVLMGVVLKLLLQSFTITSNRNQRPLGIEGFLTVPFYFFVYEGVRGSHGVTHCLIAAVFIWVPIDNSSPVRISSSFVGPYMGYSMRRSEIFHPHSTRHKLIQHQIQYKIDELMVLN